MLLWECGFPTQTEVEKQPVQAEANEYCIQDLGGGSYVQNKSQPIESARVTLCGVMVYLHCQLG